MLIRTTTATLLAALVMTPAFAQSNAAADTNRMQKQGTQTDRDRSRQGSPQADTSQGHMRHDGMGHEGMKHGAMERGDDRMMRGRMNDAQVQKMTEGWPEASRKAIQAMSEKYGPPAAVTGDMVIWGEAGPWKRTVVYREAVQHRFPMPHPDVLQQWTDYKAPPSKYDELAMYDGSVVLARTAGEISARCDKEGANFLAVNLAHEVATGKRSVEDARKKYGEQIKAMKAGQPAPYTEQLMFDAQANTQAPDEALAGM